MPMPPPAPDPNAPKKQQANAGGPAQDSESPPAPARPTRKRKLQSPAPEQPPHQLPPPPPIPGQQPQYDPYYAQPHQPLDSQGNPVPPQPTGNGSAEESPNATSATAAGRQLSTSKRAEQNRKAQRAFRERRDACVAYLCLFCQ